MEARLYVRDVLSVLRLLSVIDLDRNQVWL